MIKLVVPLLLIISSFILYKIYTESNQNQETHRIKELALSNRINIIINDYNELIIKPSVKILKDLKMNKKVLKVQEHELKFYKNTFLLEICILTKNNILILIKVVTELISNTYSDLNEIEMLEAIKLDLNYLTRIFEEVESQIMDIPKALQEKKESLFLIKNSYFIIFTLNSKLLKSKKDSFCNAIDTQIMIIDSMLSLCSKKSVFLQRIDIFIKYVEELEGICN